MKKIIAIMSVFGLVLTGCGNDDSSKEGSDEINVYTRDSSSGTRSAFEELIGFEGELVDTALETSGNGDMATKVGKDSIGIGYTSLTTDFESNNLMKVSYDGVEATQENVISGDYALSRPFSYVTRASGDFSSDSHEKLTVAFLDFLNNSIEGREAVSAEGGIVDLDGAKPWTDLKGNHPILEEDNSSIVIALGGSTSVEDTIISAYESFTPFAGGAQFEANLTGSGDGYKRVLGEEKDSANYADIGFASREFKSEEDVSKGLETGVYCKDAIVVVISNDNESEIDNLTKDDVYNIFTGKVKNWNDIKGE